MGTNSSHFSGDRLPADMVSWDNAKAFCDKLQEQESAAGRIPAGYLYRLPTEAQWEFACRAGTTTATSYGDSLSSTQANISGNNPTTVVPSTPNNGKTLDVGSFATNPWGVS